LAELTGISEPVELLVVVDVDVVVFVAPSSYVVVVVLSYPPVIFVLLPDVFVWVFVSLAESAIAVFDTITIVISSNNINKFVATHFIFIEFF
jgi:hypothetical protein